MCIRDSGNGEYIDNVWHNTVRCSANITDNGGSAIIEYGFCWVENNTETPTVEKGNKIKVGTSDITGDYSADILVRTGKSYHVRAYARNSSGVGYGCLLYTSLPLLPMKLPDPLYDVR